MARPDEKLLAALDACVALAILPFVSAARILARKKPPKLSVRQLLGGP
jgi:hypothetical protein